ncbi:MAG: hypothetical protein MJ146_03070 [Clostridia bacterium]|nr:hypothetical protein [Clostridia bacterium]
MEEVLIEEYLRLKRIQSAVEKELEVLPKGSLQVKTIHGVKCTYLAYREGDKVKSKYVNEKDVGKVADLIEKRRSDTESLKDIKRSIKQIEKALGKGKLIELTAGGVSEVH